jgi:hypothetical protein
MERRDVTVQELIEKLQQFPPDADCWVSIVDPEYESAEASTVFMERDTVYIEGVYEP